MRAVLLASEHDSVCELGWENWRISELPDWRIGGLGIGACTGQNPATTGCDSVEVAIPNGRESGIERPERPQIW